MGFLDLLGTVLGKGLKSLNNLGENTADWREKLANKPIEELEKIAKFDSNMSRKLAAMSLLRDMGIM